jgi:hypothetical protein
MLKTEPTVEEAHAIKVKTELNVDETFSNHAQVTFP